MDRLRVTLLIPTLDRSGAEKQFALLACHLPRDEFELQVLTLTRGGPYEELLRAHGVTVECLHKRFKFDPLAWYQLRQRLQANPPEVLHTWLFAANAYGRLAAGVSPNTRVVVSERCVDTWKAAWQTWLDRRLIGRTARLVGNSASVAEYYQGLGVPKEKLAVIPNAVELLTPDRSERMRVIQELELPPNAFVAMYVGRLASQKRVRDLIWATETLRQIRPQLRLIIVGDGPQRAALEAFAAAVHCERHVRFVGHQNGSVDWLQIADVFWLASEFEGQSNSLMEAMALGKPVIASDIAPNRELVTHDRTGWLVPMGDSVAFMQYTRWLIDEPDRGLRVGQAARQQMQTHHSLETMVRRYAALYRDVAGRSAVTEPEPA